MQKQKSRLYTGDAAVILKSMAANSIDAIVTDPPYGIAINNEAWDQSVPDIKLWTEALRVLKPGGHLLAFAGARTYHRMATNIERAGFDIRDQLMWIYGSGFPRSHNIALTIEKKYGAHKAKNWLGWGTTLKPAHEPIVLARKPFLGPVADNVLTFKTGGLNITSSRVGNDELRTKPRKIDGNVIRLRYKGRFPANVITTDIDEPWTLYFYCAKPTTEERDRGLEKCADNTLNIDNIKRKPHQGITGVSKNAHPTVKPIKLMKHLITLVTPNGGTVLDPFAGSGTTLIAAKQLGYTYIGIERETEYVELAQARLAA